MDVMGLTFLKTHMAGRFFSSKRDSSPYPSSFRSPQRCGRGKDWNLGRRGTEVCARRSEFNSEKGRVSCIAQPSSRIFL